MGWSQKRVKRTWNNDHEHLNQAREAQEPTGKQVRKKDEKRRKQKKSRKQNRRK